MYICNAYACIASHDQNGALLKCFFLESEFAKLSWWVNPFRGSIHRGSVSRNALYF